MKSPSLIAVLMLLAAAAAVPQEITLTAASGRVEIREPGGAWRSVAVRDAIPVGAEIATGLGARATVNVNGNLIRIEPMSRVAVSSFLREGNTATTELNLRVGRVSAEVRTAEGLQQDFRLRSTQATASVRGTSFSFDGAELRVTDGSVVLANRLNQQRTIIAGQESRAEGHRPPVRSETAIIERTVVSAEASGPDGAAQASRRRRRRATSGRIRLIIESGE